MDNRWIAFLIIAAIVIGFAALVMISITGSRKQAIQRQQAAETLGFTRIDSPPPEVIERLIPLHQRGYHKTLEVRNLQRQNHRDCTVYLYDLWDVSDNAHDLDAPAVIALAANDLDLPRFSLFPKVNIVGWTGNMANQFIEKLVGLHAQVIDFDERPNFSQRYLVTGDDELAVRHCLTGPVLAALTQTSLKNLVITGWGDALMVMHENSGNNQEDPAASIRARCDMALTLYERIRTHTPST